VNSKSPTKRARAVGTPKPFVEIPLAKDLADRVENLIGIKGTAERIRILEETMSREEAALAIGKTLRRVCSDQNRKPSKGRSWLLSAHNILLFILLLPLICSISPEQDEGYQVTIIIDPTRLFELLRH